MSYVRRSLGSDERVVYEAGFPWTYHFVSTVYLLVLGIIVVGLVVFVQRCVRAWVTEMAVTSQRVVLKQGFLTIRTEELPLDTIEEINLSQDFWGRLLGHGRLCISGTGDGAIEFPPANRALQFRAAIEDARMRSEN